MTRPTFADPKTDFAFKRIFGSEEHKDVLVAFLNDMLDLDEPHRIAHAERFHHALVGDRPHFFFLSFFSFGGRGRLLQQRKPVE